jgi:HD superfamily phosphohydrolase
MILRDPVHGLVSFERPEERIVVDLIDTPEVQRLRRVRMLGVASMAFPSAEHSRFAHAVGAAHVMKCFLARMRALEPDLSPAERLTSDDVRFALAAALVHDLGHGPLSHLFEDVFPDARAHEDWTSALLLDPDSDAHRVLATIDPGYPSAVERLVHGEHPRPYLANAVSGTFDVDRCDYLLRDSYMSGVRYGHFDLDWLLRSLRLTTGRDGARLAIDGSKGLPAVEGFFLARLFMYQQVYFHKATRAAEVMVRMLFKRAVDLVRDGGHADLPPVLLAMARGESVTASAYQSMDDGTVWGTIERWEHSTDSVLRDLSTRLRQRALFKSELLEQADVPRVEELTHAVRDIVAAQGFDPRYYATFDVADVTAYEEPVDEEDALRVIDRRGRAKTLGRSSFLMGRLRGETLLLRRLVFPAEVREKVQTLLAQS